MKSMGYERIQLSDGAELDFEGAGLYVCRPQRSANDEWMRWVKVPDASTESEYAVWVVSIASANAILTKA